jgi:hypothetical protein
VTALATRPDHRLPTEKTSNPATARSYPTDRKVHIAAAARVRAAVPDPGDQVEILKALFADGDKLRKRAASAKKQAQPAQPKPAPKSQSAHARPDMVDAGPVRDYVRSLVERKMAQQAIAVTADVSVSIISQLLHGRFCPGRPMQESIHRATADRILAVQFAPREPRPNARIPNGCRPTATFETAGHNVGRCQTCGELAPVYNGRLTRHPRRTPSTSEVSE